MSCETCKRFNSKRAHLRQDLGNTKYKLARAQEKHPERIPDLVARVEDAKARQARLAAEIEEHEAECRVAQAPALSGLHTDYVREAVPLPPAVELAALVKAGATYAEIAEEYGCAASTVGERLRASGFLQQKDETDDEEDEGPPVAGFAALRDADWMDDALCAQVDPEIFYPDKGGSTAQAKTICSLCTVAAECLDWALEQRERHGIWGGVASRDRRHLTRDTEDTPPLEHAS